MRKQIADLLAPYGKVQDIVLDDLDRYCTTLAQVLAACSPDERTRILDELTVQILSRLNNLEKSSAAKSALFRPTLSGGTNSGQPEPGIPAAPDPMSDSASDRLTPELIEWAKQQVSEEEILANLREVRRTGGLELREFIHELERAAGSHE